MLKRIVQVSLVSVLLSLFMPIANAGVWPSGSEPPIPAAPTLVSQSDPYCSDPNVRCDGIYTVWNTPAFPEGVNSETTYSSIHGFQINCTDSSGRAAGVASQGFDSNDWAAKSPLTYAQSNNGGLGGSLGYNANCIARLYYFVIRNAGDASSVTIWGTPFSFKTNGNSFFPAVAPAPDPVLPPTVSLSPCLGGTDRTPGLPQCAMPENLPGSTWNEVSNSNGVVVNGAVCSPGVCGRNGQWRTWPTNKLLNGRYFSNGFPENTTYFQAPTSGAAWGKYYTNGVYETSGGDIYQPGSTVPIRVTVPVTDTKTVTVDTRTVTVDTKTVTVDTKTATSNVDTTTVSIDTNTAITVQETITLTSINDTKTISAFLATLSEDEKEEQLQIALKSNKTAVINVSTEFAGIPVTIIATRKGYKSITINVKTDVEGDAQLKTSRNLRGFTVVLSIGKVKLDTDIVRK
jgi:hypothetical protein